jgi:hypothetical protein
MKTTERPPIIALEEIPGEQIIPPSQIYASGHDIEATEPIRRLMLAMLRDALECIAGRAGGTGNPAREALDWIEDTNDREIFSFYSVCDSLKINPEAVRESLRDWVRSGRRLERRSPVKRETAIL